MIGNRHAVAGAYIVAALGGLTVVALALIAAALEVDRARRRELEERRAAFGEIEQAERQRDHLHETAAGWHREARQLHELLVELDADPYASEPEPEPS